LKGYFAVSTECIAIIGAVATVIAGFGGAALGACFAYKTGMKLVQATHKNAIYLVQIQEFNKAASDFRCAFTSEYGAIVDMENDGDGADIETLLIKAYTLHSNALIRFKVYLSESKRTEIDKAWDDYCYGENIPGDGKSKRFEQYKFDINQLSEKKQLAIGNIERLFSFAKHK
jgi:hypothetical protein